MSTGCHDKTFLIIIIIYYFNNERVGKWRGKHFAKPYSTTDAIDTHTQQHVLLSKTHQLEERKGQRGREEDREEVVGRRKGLLGTTYSPLYMDYSPWGLKNRKIHTSRG